MLTGVSGASGYLLMKACQRVPKRMRKVTVALRSAIGLK